MTHEDFKSKFTFLESDHVVLWTASVDSIGFTLTRPYPPECLFIPAKLEDGTDDSMVGIWIGYYPDKVQDNLANLSIRVSKVSQYLLNNHWDYDFKDQQSPTQESIEISKHSPQPIELIELDRFQVDVSTGKFFDKERGQAIAPHKIIDLIYSVHVETTGASLKGRVFRAKFHSQKTAADVCGSAIDILDLINERLFDKKIKADNRFLFGVSEPYRHADLITVRPDTVLIPGTDLKLTKKVSLGAAFIIFLAFFFDFFYKQMKFVTFLESNGENIVFTLSFGVFVYVLLDKILPHVILSLTNGFIRLRWWLLGIRISIKT